MPAEAGRAAASIDVGDGLVLHAASSGAGAPLMLLHGFTGSGRAWDAVREPLAAARRVITIDLPGHGASSAPRDPARYALRRFAEDFIRVLDTLQLERVALAGYSLGGRAALQVAIQHPRRITALVLESCSPGIADPLERAQREKDDHALADVIERDGVPAFVERWEQLPLWQSQATLPATVREAQRAIRRGGTAPGLAGSLRGAGVAAAPDVTGELPEVALPTLLVAGALDDKYARIARGMAALLPQAQLAIVEDAGHAVHLERPAQFASLVGRFLDSFDR